MTPLNVLIGPNASGKSNLLEAVELLHATPTAFAAAIRDGGGVQEWLWKGNEANGHATIEALAKGEKKVPHLRYQLTFAPAGFRTEVIDEAIEEIEKRSPHERDVSSTTATNAGSPS